MTARRNKNYFPRKDFQLNSIYYSQALETHQQQHCSQEPNQLCSHWSCGLCIGLGARKILILDPLGVPHCHEKHFRYYTHFHNDFFPWIFKSKVSTDDNIYLLCIKQVYQQVEWYPRDKCNTKQVIYQNSWFNSDFEFTSDEEAALPTVAVTNLWAMFQCK